MTTKSLTAPIANKLRKTILPRLQQFEEDVLHDIDRAMAQEGAVNEIEPELIAVIKKITELFEGIRVRAANSKEMKEVLERSMSNQVAAAIMVAENLDLLHDIDPIRIANTLEMVRDEMTMKAVITELNSRGDDSQERYKWIKEAITNEEMRQTRLRQSSENGE